jgi:hypothetical protein
VRYQLSRFTIWLAKRFVARSEVMAERRLNWRDRATILQHVDTLLRRLCSFREFRAAIRGPRAEIRRRRLNRSKRIARKLLVVVE